MLKLKTDPIKAKGVAKTWKIGPKSNFKFTSIHNERSVNNTFLFFIDIIDNR